MVVGRVLFHEVGHHLDATLGSVGRTGEGSAHAWEARLSSRYLWLGLIRFRGHLPKGGYDVQTDGRYSQAPVAPAIHG
jgi:hypothetical protein